ncbi:flagellar hook-length control protein FliK [Aliamphritea spongicola]|uniref:flagellar hook-length control protein FliK n=1 Tax=Aliamphritea spongicola TaxID=707589 RepID=UPI00196B809D|nr:flagellar hook-length control protein FliK [Aliamphritea spongicola]MBN3563519.1 flagellar hook-length control protein FliK [Aliamphritea spongicola]
MNPMLPVSTGTGSLLDIGGAGAAPATAGLGANFNAMILQTSQSQTGTSALVTAQGQVQAEGGESLPPGAVSPASEQVVARADVQAGADKSGEKQTIGGSETLSQLKKFLEADVSAEYSLIQEENAQSPSSQGLSGLAALPESQPVNTQAVVGQQASQSAGVPTDQSPLSRAVHELVNAQQSAAEGNSSVAGEQSARQNTVVSESAGVKQDSAVSQQNPQQLANQSAEQLASSVKPVAGEVKAAAVTETSASVSSGDKVAQPGAVAQTAPVAEKSAETVVAATSRSANAVAESAVVQPEVAGKQSQPLVPAAAEEQKVNAQVQQLAQRAADAQAGKSVLPGQEGVVANAAGVTAEEQKAESRQVGVAAQRGAEENGLLKGLVADNKAADGQKSALPTGVSPAADSLAKLQNSASLLTDQLADQAVSKSAARASGAETVKTEGFADSLSASLANSSAVRAEKAGAEPHQLQMQQGLRPGNPAWGQAVSDRVVWLASQNGKVAEIRLDPPELGSLNVKLEIKNEQVSVVFNTPHASVKDSLEQSLPRLREMFAEQGLELADSSVEDQSSQQREDTQQREAFASGGYGAEGELDDEPEVIAGQAAQSISMVDYYA